MFLWRLVMSVIMLQEGAAQAAVTEGSFGARRGVGWGGPSKRPLGPDPHLGVLEWSAKPFNSKLPAGSRSGRGCLSRSNHFAQRLLSGMTIRPLTFHWARHNPEPRSEVWWWYLRWSFGGKCFWRLSQQKKLENLLPNFAGSSPPISPKTSPTSLWKSLVLTFHWAH